MKEVDVMVEVEAAFMRALSITNFSGGGRGELSLL
jgi:hypothetical protein